MPEPTPPETSDDFEIALNIALSEIVEQQPNIRLDMLDATVAKFQAALGDLVGVLQHG